MLKIDNLDIWGFDHAIRGMRNPMNSWDKSDTTYNYIGDNDLELMRKLFKAGVEHRKFMRMIMPSMDIVAPLYWLKELETYKIGTVSNSCSTMHKIHAKEFTLDDFSVEHLNVESMAVFGQILDVLNNARSKFLATKSKDWWWQMIQLLPSSYNQRRTILLNYEVAAKIIKERSNHKLDEWCYMVDYFKQNLHWLDAIMGGKIK